jgi:hypothetical protein
MGRLHEIIDIKTNLRKRGFDHTFMLEHECIRCLEYGELITPQDFEVTEIHYCKTPKNDNNSIIYGIVLSQHGIKGILISHYQCYLTGMSLQLWHKFANILQMMIVQGINRPVNNHLVIVRYNN